MLRPSLLLASSLLGLTPLATAQCGGQGSALLEIISVDNGGTLPGSEVTIRLSGPPNAHACFLCDTDDGPTVLPGIGSFCLGFTPSAAAIAFQFPASGFIE